MKDWELECEAAWKEECAAIDAANTVASKTVVALERQIKPDDSTLEREHIEKRIAAERARIRRLPPEPRLFSSDTTEERLFQLMHERDGAFSVMSGEARPIVDAIIGKYSDGRTGDAFYLAGISGDDITRDRVGNERTGPESRVIRKPALNVCGMVQPDKMLEAARHPSLRASGALARILPVWLPSLVGTRMDSVDEGGLDLLRLMPFYALIRNILAARPARLNKPPHIARLSREASEARREFHNRLEGQMKTGGALDDARDIASKAVSATVKIAGVLHVLEHPEVLARDTSEIDLTAWERAQRIGEYYLGEAVRIPRLAGEDEGLSEAASAAAWIARDWESSEISARDLLRHMTRPRPKDAAHANAIIRTLTDHGYLAVRPPRGEERKPRYTVHPRIRDFASKVT